MAPNDLRHAARRAAPGRRHAGDCARIAALPVRHAHAAGIDAGDATHWACDAATPDGSEPIRRFPVPTPGLRRLVARLKLCGVPTVASHRRLRPCPDAEVEASGRAEQG